MKKRLFGIMACLALSGLVLSGCDNLTSLLDKPVTGVSLNKTTLELTVNHSEILSETITPADATDRTVTWSSSDPSIATVDDDGEVTGKKPGIATIIVTTNDGEKTAQCTVTVTVDSDPGTEEPGKEEPGKEEPGKEEPGKEEPGKEEPGTEEPGKEEPGKEEPGKEEPSKEEPGKEEPGKEEPGKEEPGKEEPGKEEPGKEEPGKEESTYITINFKEMDIIVGNDSTGGSVLNISVDNAGSYNNLFWFLDGGEPVATDGSIHFDTAQLTPGKHRITVIARTKAGILYSQEVIVTNELRRK
jgi:hypothetical protein